MVAGVTVLGIEVGAQLLDCWQRWLAPSPQPFFVESLDNWPRSPVQGGLTPEHRDTYKQWRLDPSLRVLWLDETTFFGLTRAQRASLVREQARIGRGAVPSVRAWASLLDHAALRQQADGHRFVWWPSLLGARAAEVLARVVATEGIRSRHREVSRGTWDRCAVVLPAARRLAGTFPTGSGANCFGTVMAAAGVPGAADDWMLQEPFDEWLASACRPASRPDHRAGSVLVWRDSDDQPVHAAITIGDGWALEKPSQAWSTPRTVLAVDDVIRVNRAPGQRLERHRLRQLC